MALPHPPPFGLQLRRERLAHGLTQDALAERASLSTRAISDLERGVNRAPRKETLRLLADALQLAPDERARLEAAYHWSTAATEHWLPSDATRAPLVGRAQEMAQLEQHLAGEGAPLCMLTGEPGIGKTRLLHEVSQRAIAYGWTVLEGGCQRSAGQEPFAPLLGAFSVHLARQSSTQRRRNLDGCAWLVRLLPELAETIVAPHVGWTLPAQQERRLMFGAARRFLANVAGPSGTLLVLDDLQWTGADALDLLLGLLRSEKQPPLRVLCAYRDSEVDEHHPLAILLADLASARLASQLEIGPLAPDESSELLSGLLTEFGVPDADAGSTLRTEVVRRAGGVPFFLVSCAQSVGQATPLPPGRSNAVPWDITHSIRQRMAALPEGARQLLSAAAVMGRVVPDTVLIAIVEKPEAESLLALDAARRARLLVESGPSSYQFPHDLIREVVAAELSPQRRKWLHRRVAESLERQSVEVAVELLAYHFGQAGDEEKALIYLERAGDRALDMRAHAEAEAHYRDVIERLEALARVSDLARVYEKLGLVLFSAARYDAAVGALTQAAQTYRMTGNLEGWGRALARLGRAHAHRGTIREGQALLSSAIAQLESAGAPPAVTADLCVVQANLCSVSGQHSDQLAVATRAAALAQAANEQQFLAEAELYRGYALGALHQDDDSLRVIERVIPEAEASGALSTLSDALNYVAQTYEDRGEFHKSMPYMERALQVAAELGDPVQLALLTCNRGQSAFYQGDWRGARAYHEQAVSMMRALETSLISTYPYGGLGALSLAQGERDLGLRYLRALEAATLDVDLGALRYVRGILAEYELIEGQPAAALALLTPLLDRPEQEEAGVIKLLPLVAWAHHELRHDDEAQAVMTQWDVRMAERKLSRLRAEGLRIEALLAQRQDGRQAAEARLQEALDLCDEMGYPYCKAKTLYVYGLLDTQHGDAEKARDHFHAALAVLDQLGEQFYAAHIREALDALR